MSIVRSFAVVVALGAVQVSAQTYPTKPIRIITGAPGGGIDLIARVVGQTLTTALGQPTVVENRGFGGGLIVGEMLAKAQPDGYTLMSYSSNIWLLPLLRSQAAYDPQRDFAPVTFVSAAPNVLVVTPSLPVNSVKELIAYARERPGKLNYAHAGVGDAVHMAAELFISMTNTNIVPVAYKANPLAFADLMTGQVQVMFGVTLSIMPLVSSGKVKALGVATSKRTPVAPGLPTIAESGVPGYEHMAINAVFAPAKTPAPVVAKLNEVLVQWLRSPEARDLFFKYGAEPMSGSPAEVAAFIKGDITKWAKIIKERNIRVD